MSISAPPVMLLGKHSGAFCCNVVVTRIIASVSWILVVAVSPMPLSLSVSLLHRPHHHPQCFLCCELRTDISRVSRTASARAEQEVSSHQAFCNLPVFRSSQQRAVTEAIFNWRIVYPRIVMPTKSCTMDLKLYQAELEGNSCRCCLGPWR